MTKRAFLLLVFALAASSAAFAADDAPGWSYRLASELMSPFCPGRALSDCPSPDASELREWIIVQEKAGAMKADVEAQLFGKWGDQLRQSPRADGVGALAYAIPGIALVAGAAIVFAFLRKQAAAATARPLVARAASDDELEREIDRELGA